MKKLISGIKRIMDIFGIIILLLILLLRSVVSSEQCVDWPIDDLELYVSDVKYSQMYRGVLDCEGNLTSVTVYAYTLGSIGLIFNYPGFDSEHGEVLQMTNIGYNKLYFDQAVYVDHNVRLWIVVEYRDGLSLLKEMMIPEKRDTKLL